MLAEDPETLLRRLMMGELDALNARQEQAREAQRRCGKASDPVDMNRYRSGASENALIERRARRDCSACGTLRPRDAFRWKRGGFYCADNPRCRRIADSWKSVPE